MINFPLVYKTYQDVKNNLVYWTFILLVASSAIIYFLFLNSIQQDALVSLITNIGANPLFATIAGAILISIYFLAAYLLVYIFQIHDVLYDKFIIRWRERYDIEFIIPRITESFKQQLPKNFTDFTSHYHEKFMVPFYKFVGDRQNGISENTRIRFYESVTPYWATQLNEIFILSFLVITPIFVLQPTHGGFNLTTFSLFMLILIFLALLNRWFIRLTLVNTKKRTEEEIDEILSKSKNKEILRQSYIKLCADNRL